METAIKNPFDHDVGKNEEELVNVQYNDAWIQVPRGLNVVEVAKRQGDFIPHYCYHPKLSISGNCRMCLFEMGMPKRDAERKPIIDDEGKPEIGWMPRPQIGCATQVNEGMGIRTNSPLATECRKSVMEFLLINHPLDCPICDQAGECKLQEFSSEYGTAESRFVENKVKKPKAVDLGERIVLDNERCVLCTRCIRFSSEVMNDDVLGIVNRGGYNAIATHPERPFDNPYSLNTVDICPVGALTTKDFRFKMRVWFLQETKSICTDCATGCNILIGAREGMVHRLTPRTNEAVNSHWMCDAGRLGFHYLHDENRLEQPTIGKGKSAIPSTWDQFFRDLGKNLKAFSSDEIAIVASASSTNEELFLIKRLADELKVKWLDVIPRKGKGDGFLGHPDRNANTLGAKHTGVSQSGKDLLKIKKDVEAGSIKCLITWQEDLVAAEFDKTALEKLKLLIAASILPNETTSLAGYVLPVAGFAEKRGTMVNGHNRIQRLNKAIPAPGNALEDWEALCRLREVASGGNGIHQFEDLSKSMFETVSAFKGLDWNKVGDLGVQLEG